MLAVEGSGEVQLAAVQFAGEGAYFDHPIKGAQFDQHIGDSMRIKYRLLDAQLRFGIDEADDIQWQWFVATGRRRFALRLGGSFWPRQCQERRVQQVELQHGINLRAFKAGIAQGARAPGGTQFEFELQVGNLARGIYLRH